MNINREYIRLGGILVGGLAIGYGAGYLLTKTRLEKRANAEIESVKEEFAEYSRVNKVGPFASPEKAFETLHPEQSIVFETGLSEKEIVDAAQRATRVDPAKVAYHKVVVSEGYDTPDEDSTAQAVLDEGIRLIPGDGAITGGVVVNEESATVFDERAPHIISDEEFAEPFENHEKITLTWFEGDNLLISEDNSQIVSDHGIIGDYPLTQFGSKGFADPDIVHVRNRRIQSDFEVVRDRRTYDEVVLGITPIPDGGR